MDSQAELHHEIQQFLKRKRDENRSLLNLIQALNHLGGDASRSKQIQSAKNHKP